MASWSGRARRLRQGRRARDNAARRSGAACQAAGPAPRGRSPALPRYRDDGPRDGGGDAGVPCRARLVGGQPVPADPAPPPRPRRRAGAPRRARVADPAGRLAGHVQRTGVRLAAARGPLPDGRFEPAAARRPPRPPADRPPRLPSSHGRRPPRLRRDGAARPQAARDVAGWEIPSRYLDYLRFGEPGPLADVVRHNDEDVRSLARLLVHLDRGYADGERWTEAPPGDLAGLARAFAREGRHERGPRLPGCRAGRPPGRPRDKGTDEEPAPERARLAARESRSDDDAWWSPRRRPDFGGRAGRYPAGGVGRRRVEPAGRPMDGDADAGRTGAPAAAARPVRRRGGCLGGHRCEPGPVGTLAWVEVAKLREHRLGDLSGAIEAATAALRLAERQAWLGRPLAAARGMRSGGGSQGSALGSSGAPRTASRSGHAIEARALDRQRSPRRRRGSTSPAGATAGACRPASRPGRRRRRRSGRPWRPTGSPGSGGRRPLVPRRARQEEPAVDALGPGQGRAGVEMREQLLGRRPGRDVLAAHDGQVEPRGGPETGSGRRARPGRPPRAAGAGPASPVPTSGAGWPAASIAQSSPISPATGRAAARRSRRSSGAAGRSPGSGRRRRGAGG